MTSSEAVRRNHWTGRGRFTVFTLASTSILSLLVEFYRFCPMRDFTLVVFIPALLGLGILAWADRVVGTGALWRAVLVGASAGLAAAVCYDLFRLPFVFAKEWGIDSVVPAMKLFKVFPRFGAMILGQPLEQPTYSFAAHLAGWAYHFSNGASFGVMYLALIGHPAKRHWLWGVVMAVGIELGMLATPYGSVFSIHVSGRFVAVTLTAHLIFGTVMGWLALRLQARLVPQP